EPSGRKAQNTATIVLCGDVDCADAQPQTYRLRAWLCHTSVVAANGLSVYTANFRPQAILKVTGFPLLFNTRRTRGPSGFRKATSSRLPCQNVLEEIRSAPR